VQDSLRGIQYLHSMRKIHRDIKAGNILVNAEGRAKLADFGVAGQLTRTLSQRRTVIGSPFWMAPEVIEEVGYGEKVDVWSLGITCIELAEGAPPMSEIHPMRAIFLIPSRPPPTLANEAKWSPAFVEFVRRCLVKDPAERASAADMLRDGFVVGAAGPSCLAPLLAEQKQTIDKVGRIEALGLDKDDGSSSSSQGTGTGLDTGRVAQATGASIALPGDSCGSGGLTGSSHSVFFTPESGDSTGSGTTKLVQVTEQEAVQPPQQSPRKMKRMSRMVSREDELRLLRSDIDGLQGQLDVMMQERQQHNAAAEQLKAEKHKLMDEMDAMRIRLQAAERQTEIHRQKHFMSLALALKLESQLLGWMTATGVSVSDLWDLAVSTGVAESQWDEWITKKLHEDSARQQQQ
jgi:serine/threonine protein kinase